MIKMALELSNAQRAEVLTQALPYIQKYYKKIIVIKYGGNAMINEELKQQVMEDIVLLSLIGVKVVLVHGGGPEITDMLKKIGKESVFVDGLRVTDKETAALWHGYNAKIVIIKHGKDGSTAYTNDGESYSIKPFPVKLLKSFGGGDGYASAFLYGLFEGYEMMDALEFGSASAAMLVASHACSQDMPTVEAVKEFIKKEKEEYGEMVARA